MKAKQPAAITTTFFLGGKGFDPEVFSRIVGMSPTEIWHPRLEQVKNDPRFDQIGWTYKLLKRPHWSIDDAIRELLDLFDGHQESIVSFAQQHNCSVHIRCRLYGDETAIVYQIERSTMERLASLECTLSFSVDPRVHQNA